MIAIMFNFTTPLMINGDAQWGVKTGFLLVHHGLYCSTHRQANVFHSFAGTGTVAVVICWFILPEVACRTAAEIDEMYVSNHHTISLSIANPLSLDRFEKKISLRKFKEYSSGSY